MFHSPCWHRKYSRSEVTTQCWLWFQGGLRGVLFTGWALSVRPTGSRHSSSAASPLQASVSCELHPSGRCCPGQKGHSGKPRPSLRANPRRWTEYSWVRVHGSYQRVQRVNMIHFLMLPDSRQHVWLPLVSIPGPVWTLGALCVGSSGCFPPGQPQTCQWPKKCSPSAW